MFLLTERFYTSQSEKIKRGGSSFKRKVPMTRALFKYWVKIHNEHTYKFIYWSYTKTHKYLPVNTVIYNTIHQHFNTEIIKKTVMPSFSAKTRNNKTPATFKIPAQKLLSIIIMSGCRAAALQIVGHGPLARF